MLKKICTLTVLSLIAIGSLLTAKNSSAIPNLSNEVIAQNNVYTIRQPYNRFFLVTDSNEWECTLSQGVPISSSFCISRNYAVTGYYIPLNSVSFTFSIHNKHSEMMFDECTAKKRAYSYLKKWSDWTGSKFSYPKLKEEGKTYLRFPYYAFEGTYSDNYSSGDYVLYTEGHSNDSYYIMIVKIQKKEDEDSLDEQIKNELSKKAFDLICRTGRPKKKLHDKDTIRHIEPVRPNRN